MSELPAQDGANQSTSRTSEAGLNAANLIVESESSVTVTSRFTNWFSTPNAPYIIFGLVVAIAALFTVHAVKPNLLRFNIGAPPIVVFDPVKFLNAQRAAAAIMATNPNAELSLTLTQVAKQAESVIAEEANGALVLVRQAVVGADRYTDITDRVLQRFGLDTKVPTVTIKQGLSMSDIAPTDFSMGSGQIREDYRMELNAKASEMRDNVKKAGNQIDIVP